MPTYKIYCDESRQAKKQGRYILVGSVWIKSEYGWNYVKEFEEYCCNTLGLSLPMGHMAWKFVPTKPEGKYYEAYKKLIDLYFSFNSENIMYYRVIVADKEIYDFKHPDYYSGDYESGFYNLYCQLILNWVQKGNTYHVRVASRYIKKSSPEDSEEFRLNLLLNKINTKFRNRIFKYYFSQLVDPIASIEPRAARNRRLIQVADILTGAVGYHWNDENLKENCSKGRFYLANYIAQQLNREDLKFTTSWNDKRFNIFFFDTSKI